MNDNTYFAFRRSGLKCCPALPVETAPMDVRRGWCRAPVGPEEPVAYSAEPRPVEV